VIFSFAIGCQCLSVSAKGAEYLKSAGPDHQPPLFLPLVAEMDEEEHGCKQGEGEGEGFNSLTSSKCEGLSEVGNIFHVTLYAATPLTQKITKG